MVFLRHFHKAVWSEQRYRELLSTSTESLASAQLDNTHQLSSAHQPTARRRLSSSFTSMQFTTPTMPIVGGESPQLSGQMSSRQNVTPTTSPEGSVDGECVMGEAGDPLQQTNSSDNVFTELENSSFQTLFPSNRRNSIHSEHHSTCNMSPQITKLCLHRPNPLISHTNGSRARSQSAFSVGREELYSIFPNCSPLSRRATLALIGRHYHSGRGHATGSLSPLATGHKTRTASGKL